VNNQIAVAGRNVAFNFKVTAKESKQFTCKQLVNIQIVEELGQWFSALCRCGPLCFVNDFSISEKLDSVVSKREHLNRPGKDSNFRLRR